MRFSATNRERESSCSASLAVHIARGAVNVRYSKTSTIELLKTCGIIAKGRRFCSSVARAFMDVVKGLL